MSELVSIHRLTKPSLLAAGDAAVERVVPTRKRPIVISASELRDWLRCRVKHHWRHQCRLVPKKGIENLGIGILVHEILEQWYGQPWKERSVKRMAWLAKRRLRGTIPHDLDIESLELVRAMTIGYAAWAKPQDLEIGLRECTPERWYELPLAEGRIIVRGKIDLVFEPRTLKRTMALNEYKTKAQIRVDMVDLNLQISVYLWALRQLFPKHRRYIAYYNVLRKQMPGPRVKADLFHREAVERTDDEIDQWTKDTERAALDMVGAAIYPNPMDSCAWDCDYQGPCLMRGRPSDLKDLLKREFRPKGE